MRAKRAKQQKQARHNRWDTAATTTIEVKGFEILPPNPWGNSGLRLSSGEEFRFAGPATRWHSDEDYASISAWNKALAAVIGGLKAGQLTSAQALAKIREHK